MKRLIWIAAACACFGQEPRELKPAEVHPCPTAWYVWYESPAMRITLCAKSNRFVALTIKQDLMDRQECLAVLNKIEKILTPPEKRK